eukprot:1466834-Prymnesium_polylepis.2
MAIGNAIGRTLSVTDSTRAFESDRKLVCSRALWICGTKRNLKSCRVTAHSAAAANASQSGDRHIFLRTELAYPSLDCEDRGPALHRCHLSKR